MKYSNFFLVFFLAIGLVTSSCNNDDTGTENPIPAESGKVIAVSELGAASAIDIATGQSVVLGQIEGITSFMISSTITQSDDKVFGVEYVYEPGPINRLFVYDRSTNTSQSVDLVLPQEIPGEERGIVAMAWNGTELLCIVMENVLVSQSPVHVATIDPANNYEMALLPVELGSDEFFSMAANATTAYLSTSSAGILVLDLQANTSSPLVPGTITNGSKLSLAGDELYFTELSGEDKFPSVITLTDLSITRLSSPAPIASQRTTGFYDADKGEYLLITSGGSSEPFLELYRAEFAANSASTVSLSGSGLTSNMVIVGVEEE